MMISYKLYLQCIWVTILICMTVQCIDCLSIQDSSLITRGKQPSSLLDYLYREHPFSRQNKRYLSEDDRRTTDEAAAQDEDSQNVDETLLTSSYPKHQSRLHKRFAEVGTLKDMLFEPREEPSLFDLLISALEEEPLEEQEVENTEKKIKQIKTSGGGGSASRGRSGGRSKQFYQTRPCYWSLVSCYRRKRSKP